jgi:hypothetical protein
LAKLVYIGGYGRSGSTLLEYLLTAHPGVVGCGEVERHLRRLGKRKICTCGQRMKRCPVWGAFQHWSGKLEGRDHEQLSLALLEHVSGQYAIMVDSSKTAWGSTFMPFRMSKRLGKDFLLVHLVRDPRAVAWSTMRAPRRQKWTGEGRLKVNSKSRRYSSPIARSLRTLAGWTIANLACETFGLLHPDCCLRIRYEDLVHAPLKVVGQILTRVSLDPPPMLEQSESRGNRHQLYGNAMRFGIVSPSDLKEDAAWKTAMPKAYRRLIGSLSWPLCLRYDYGLRVDGEANPPN